MFKTLVRIYIENRINCIEKEIEEIANSIAEDESKAIQQGLVASALNEISQVNIKRFKILKTKVALYSLLFGEVK